MVLCLMLIMKAALLMCMCAHTIYAIFFQLLPYSWSLSNAVWGCMLVGQGTQASCTHLWYAKICYGQSCLVDNFLLQEAGCLDKEEVPCRARVKALVFPMLSTVCSAGICPRVRGHSPMLAQLAVQAKPQVHLTKSSFPSPILTKSVDITCSGLLQPPVPQNSATCQAQVRLTPQFSTLLELREHHSDGQSKLLSPCHVCLQGNGMFMFIPIDPDGWHFCSI